MSNQSEISLKYKENYTQMLNKLIILNNDVRLTEYTACPFFKNLSSNLIVD